MNINITIQWLLLLTVFLATIGTAAVAFRTFIWTVDRLVKGEK